MSAPLTAAQAALLAQVAGVLLPEGDGLPGGAGLAFDAALAAEPLLVEGVRAALAALAEDPDGLEAAVAGLEAGRRGDAGDALLLVILATYYGQPAVRRAIGYPGPMAIPLPPLPDEDDAVLAPLLDRVRARGPRYRDISPS